MTRRWTYTIANMPPTIASMTSLDRILFINDFFFFLIAIFSFILSLQNISIDFIIFLTASQQKSAQSSVTRITAKPVGEGVRIETPFYTDFGKNITVGNHVFINAGCKFQDQGGIFIGDGTFIGHNTVLATLDHDIDPDKRHLLYPAPIHIGNKVWIGAGVIITKGVTIGDNSVIAAGAVVTHDIPANVIAAGVPAKVLREI